MTKDEALKLALEALEYPLNQSHENFNVDMAELISHRAITAIKEALAQPEQEPDGVRLVVSGAIFDFAGYLTTRDKVIEVGSTANASPVADLVKEWAALRGLSLENPAVLSWQEWLIPVSTSDTSQERVDETAKQRHEQEPVAVRLSNGVIDVLGGAIVPIGALLYTTPPQRKPLTYQEFQKICTRLSRQGGWDGDGWDLALKEAIEAAHGIKE